MIIFYKLRTLNSLSASLIISDGPMSRFSTGLSRKLLIHTNFRYIIRQEIKLRFLFSFITAFSEVYQQIIGSWKNFYRKEGREMPFGEKARKARLALNLSQAELAQMTGISERSLYTYEQLGTLPRKNNIIKLAEALQIYSPRKNTENINCRNKAHNIRPHSQRNVFCVQF